MPGRLSAARAVPAWRKLSPPLWASARSRGQCAQRGKIIDLGGGESPRPGYPGARSCYIHPRARDRALAARHSAPHSPVAGDAGHSACNRRRTDFADARRRCRRRFHRRRLNGVWKRRRESRAGWPGQHHQVQTENGRRFTSHGLHSGPKSVLHAAAAVFRARWTNLAQRSANIGCRRLSQSVEADSAQLGDDGGDARQLGRAVAFWGRPAARCSAVV